MLAALMDASWVGSRVASMVLQSAVSWVEKTAVKRAI